MVLSFVPNPVVRCELARPGELSTTTKRYIERVTHALEKTQSKSVMLRMELAAQKQLHHSERDHALHAARNRPTHVSPHTSHMLQPLHVSYCRR